MDTKRYGVRSDWGWWYAGADTNRLPRWKVSPGDALRMTEAEAEECASVASRTQPCRVELLPARDDVPPESGDAFIESMLDVDAEHQRDCSNERTEFRYL